MVKVGIIVDGKRLTTRDFSFNLWNFNGENVNIKSNIDLGRATIKKKMEIQLSYQQTEEKNYNWYQEDHILIHILHQILVHQQVFACNNLLDQDSSKIIKMEILSN